MATIRRRGVPGVGPADCQQPCGIGGWGDPCPCPGWYCDFSSSFPEVGVCRPGTETAPGRERSSRECFSEELMCTCDTVNEWYCPDNNDCVTGCPGAQGNDPDYQDSWGSPCDCPSQPPGGGTGKFRCQPGDLNYPACLKKQMVVRRTGGRVNTDSNSRFSGRTQANPKGKFKK